MQRQTRQRQAMLEVFQQAQEHLTAAQVYERVRQVLPTIGYATVYRHLSAMAAEGLIRELRMGEVSQYDRRAERHDHVVCRRCGKVADAMLPLSEEAVRAVATATGFEIDEHHTELSGLCPDCR